MSCCGKLRAALRQQTITEPVRQAAPYPSAGFAARAVEFEYSGHSQLAVTGPLTGVVYRFRGQGARLLVDGSDARSLVAVPGLKAIR